MTSIADTYLHPLPSYLAPDQMPEPEHIPMQVLLLTHEVANLRTRLNLLAETLLTLGQQVQMPTDPLLGGLTDE